MPREDDVAAPERGDHYQYRCGKQFGEEHSEYRKNKRRENKRPKDHPLVFPVGGGIDQLGLIMPAPPVMLLRQRRIISDPVDKKCFIGSLGLSNPPPQSDEPNCSKRYRNQSPKTISRGRHRQW